MLSEDGLCWQCKNWNSIIYLSLSLTQKGDFANMLF